MRYSMLLICLALAVATALTGCARKQDDTAASASDDSLLASNPLETPDGSLTPQQQFEPAPPPSPSPQAPRPRRTAANESAPPPKQQPQAMPRLNPVRTPQSPGLLVQWGSFLHVTVSDAISSETAHPGDAWSGTLRDTVFVRYDVAFPAGSIVHGTVKDAKPAKAGDRALLQLQVTSIDAFGQTYPVNGTMDPIIPGSPRARNLGAIAGGAAAGALIGSAVGGGKGSVVGGLVGGAAAGGAVAHSKGFQAEVKPGSSVTFTVAKDVVVRR